MAGSGGSKSTVLAGTIVLDLTRARAGPTAARQMADWGADAIKIEMPGQDGSDVGRRHGADFQNLHRNKRSMTLDLKAPAGRDTFLRMAEKADVVIENYRPAVKDRLGIDYKSVAERNPRIVYASISGFGQDGPYRERPCLDQIAQGMGGHMASTGRAGEGPMRSGAAIADVSAGLLAANGILLALLERTTSGKGQWVQTSLLEAQIFIMDFQAARWLVEREVPPQAGNDHPNIVPTGAFRTADGYINIAPTPAMWTRLCQVLGLDEMIEDPKFASFEARYQNRDAVNAAITAVTSGRNSADWIAHLNEHGIPAGPIYTLDQTFADPQVLHTGIAQPIESPVLGSIEVVGQAVKLSRTPSIQSHAPAPEYSGDTMAVLDQFGFSAAEVGALRANGVI